MVFCHVFRLSQCWYLVFNGPSWVPAQWAGVTRGHLLLICFLLIGTSLLLLCTALTLVSEPCFCHEGPCRGCQYLYWDLATANDGVPASVNTTLPPPSRPPLVSIFSKQLLIALPPIYNCLWCAHFHNSPVKCRYFEPNLKIWCDVKNCKLGTKSVNNFNLQSLKNNCTEMQMVGKLAHMPTETIMDFSKRVVVPLYSAKL